MSKALTMDPEFAALIKHPRAVLSSANAVREALIAARQGTDPFELNPELILEERFVSPSKEGEIHVPIRIYRRRDSVAALPLLLYLHGGGFFCGDVRSEETQCVRFALEVGCMVVSVGYRLAPEEPFPAALTDCYQVLDFLWDNKADLNIDQRCIAVGGSSAGANLAAAVSLLARDRMGPKICFQMLLVPVLDDRLETSSARHFVDVPDFGRSEAETMWRWYLGGESRSVSSHAAPARAQDLTALPPAYILCAGLDPLRDEGLIYAHRLAEAGVPVELHLMSTIPHGFASVPSAVLSQRLFREQVEVLRGALRSKTVEPLVD